MRINLRSCPLIPVIIAVFLVGSGAVASAVYAHQGAKGVVMERMETMKTLAKAMKSVSLMVRGKTPFERDKVMVEANAIAKHGARIVGLFPKGSGDGVSEASPAIWWDPQGFKQRAKAMVAAAEGLSTAAQTTEVATASAFRALGKTCSSCHKVYRTKKKKMRH